MSVNKYPTEKSGIVVAAVANAAAVRIPVVPADQPPEKLHRMPRPRFIYHSNSNNSYNSNNNNTDITTITITLSKHNIVMIFVFSSSKFAVAHVYRIPNGAPGCGVSGNNGLGYWDESRTIIEPPKEQEKIIKRSKPEVMTEVADTLHSVRPPCEYNIMI